MPIIKNRFLTMKVKEQIKKDFDAVSMMRKIRDKIDRETTGMTFEQLKKNYEKKAKKSDLKTD